MRRALVVGVALAAVAAGDAGASVRPVATGNVAIGPVLAGDRVLWGETTGSSLRLRSVSLAGGRPVTLMRLTLEGPDPSWLGLDASPVRAAFALGSDADEAIPMAGPPSGPFEPIGRPARSLRVAVAGDAVITVQRPPLHVLVHRAGSSPTELRPPDGATGLAAEGGVVAFSVHTGEDDPRDPEVAVMDLATGQERYRVPLRGESFDVQADGKVAMAGLRWLAWASPTEPRLHRIPTSPALWPEPLELAGDRIVVRAVGRPVPTGGTGITADRRLVVGLDGRVAPISPRSVYLGGVDFDGRHVAWSAGDCILVSDLQGPAPVAIPPGPCPRAELVLEDLPPVVQRTFRTSVSCVSAPRGECRGIVRVIRGRGTIIARARFRLAAGRRGSVHLRVSGRRIDRPAAIRVEARVRNRGAPPSVATVTTFLARARR
jgi:hypothetical protein